MIDYKFPSGSGDKWSKPSGFYPFTHYKGGADRAFLGKPVEGAFSHDGRYLWVTFYRRSFDINAQDPSALAVVDTRTDTIVRIFETGPLPKMVAVSPDSKYVAVTHWGDNTVGIIDISSSDIKKWRHLSPVVFGNKLTLDFPLDTEVNRDANSGNLLRGTVFTPDGKWLLVSGMAGPMYVIDVEGWKVPGHVNQVYGIRHLAISKGYVYGSHNINGTVLQFPLDSLISDVKKARKEGRSNLSTNSIKTCKVGKGARTLTVSPDGRYLFVACNTESALYVVDTRTMKPVDKIGIDSFPVGLAISNDGIYLAVTSQGKKGKGGNALNLVKVVRPYYEAPKRDSCVSAAANAVTVDSKAAVKAFDRKADTSSVGNCLTARQAVSASGFILAIIAAVMLTNRFIGPRKE